MPNRFAWNLLCISLLCCVFDGALRKWGVGDSSIAGRIAYLSKDIVIAAFLIIGSRRANPMTNIAQPFLKSGIALLGIGALLSCAFGFQPVGAFLTIRTFFVLPIAAWMGGQLLPANSLRRFALWMAILSLPLAGLGACQFFSSSTSPINRYSTIGENVATAAASERVRATGTFSYITGFSEFATMAVWAGIVTFTLGTTRRERWLGYAGLSAGMCCTFVTVTRAAVATSIGLVIVWAIAGGQFGRKAQAAITICALVLLTLFFTATWDAAYEIAATVYRRHETSSDTLSDRLWYSFVLPMDAIVVAPLGNGLGSEQAGRTLSAPTTRLGSTFETPWGRTIMELGLFGLFGFLVTLGTLFAPVKAAYRRNNQRDQRTVLAVTGAALLAKALIGFQFNHVAAYFFWATTAAVLALANGSPPPSTPAPSTRFKRHKSLTTH